MHKMCTYIHIYIYIYIYICIGAMIVWGCCWRLSYAGVTHINVTTAYQCVTFMSHGTHTQKRHHPPDPISHVCSLTGKSICRKCFTSRSVQIFKIMFRRFLFSRIWSSAQDHALLVLLLNLVGFFMSRWQNLPVGNDLYWRCTSFEKAGPALKYFTWLIGTGGSHEWHRVTQRIQQYPRVTHITSQVLV